MTLECADCGHHWTPPDEPVDDYDAALTGMLIDWPAFWNVDHTLAIWLAEPILAANRSTALFAPGGTGKSLLALWLSAMLATGHDPFTGRDIAPIDVLYLDYEMTEADLSERLDEMGFGDHVFDHLHYALLPSLPGLDEPEGGKAVVRLAQLVDARLVVIDTFGRAVHGDENDADTVRAWYRWTGIHLKADGRAFLRVDHAGKDLTKGQRGTSAKNDDVDVVWQMTAKEDGAYTLTAKKRRMGWVPQTVNLIQGDDPLTYRLVDGETWPAGTKEAADDLDDLGVPPTAGERPAGQALRDAGRKRRNEVVRAAQKYRRLRSQTINVNGRDNARSTAPESLRRTPDETTAAHPSGADGANGAKPHVDELRRNARRSAAQPPPSMRRNAPLSKGRSAQTNDPDDF